MLRTLAYDVIGTGPKVSFQTGDKAVDSEIEWAFWNWSRAINWPEKLRLMRLARARDGESFARFVYNRNVYNPVKLDVVLYEAEQIAAPNLANDLTDGFILDDFGNVIGYTVLSQHPGQSINLTLDYETVPARDMIHSAHIERAGQHRGCPEIAPALPLYALLRRYTLAVIGAAEAAADIAGVVKTNQLPVGTDPADLEALDCLTIERKSFLTMPKGWDINQLKSEQPTTTYEMFKRQIIAEIARCLSMPYNIAAGDSSSFNYSSARLDFRNWQRTRQVDRCQIEWRELDPTIDRWWQEARLIDGVLPDVVRGLAEPPRHSVSWDGDLHIDPQKEAQAQAQRLSSMTTTLEEEYAREGKDWEQAVRQIARERELVSELGLMPVAAPPTEEPTDEEEPTEEP